MERKGVTIKGVKYAPKISNSILLRYTALNDIDLLNIKIDYIFAADLFAFAVNNEGGDLTIAEIDDEIDNRLDAFAEVLLYITAQINPSSVGEEKPVKAGKVKSQAKV
jgi:hypothetical protein